MLEDVGFVKVQVEDRTEQFVNILHSELERLKTVRQEFLQVLKIYLRTIYVKKNERRGQNHIKVESLGTLPTLSEFLQNSITRNFD